MWDSYPDLRTTHYGAISAAGAAGEAVALPFASDAMAPLPAGGAFVARRSCGAQASPTRCSVPGARAARLRIAVRYPSQQAVVAAKPCGTFAILGGAACRRSSTICDERAH